MSAIIAGIVIIGRIWLVNLGGGGEVWAGWDYGFGHWHVISFGKNVFEVSGTKNLRYPAEFEVLGG